MLTEAFRVVIVNGPRQSGKSTLLQLFHEEHGGSLRSLDDEPTLTPALADPTAFARYGDRPVIIDEIQRGGDPLVLAIKYLVDRDNSRGQFILAGSTRFLTVPTLSESLAGRAALIDLWPFSTAERAGVDNALSGVLIDRPGDLLDARSSPWSREDYLELICTGGFPEVISLPGMARRVWFESYLQTVVQRDVRQFANIQHGSLIPRLLSMLAARAGSPLVATDLARSVELNQSTIRNYLTYLDTVFLTVAIPAWSTNLNTKQVKTPRSYLSDSGLAAHLLDVDAEGLRVPGHPALGNLVETFVATELVKILADQDRGIALRHFRDRDGREIDFILESRDGRVTGIEVKATSTPSGKDFRHLIWLRDRLGDRFTGGIVVHLGQDSYPFGDRLYSVPISALWGHAPLSGATSG